MKRWPRSPTRTRGSTSSCAASPTSSASPAASRSRTRARATSPRCARASPCCPSSRLRSRAAQVPADYRRRQTLKNAERYITPELKEFEDKALSARDRALALEKSLYDELVALLAAHLPALQRIARALAQLDVLACFAGVSSKRSYCRPEFVEDILIEIDAGRHPVDLDEDVFDEFRPRSEEHT